ncbi:MAG: helix-hairpin-helix domain-containing protein, partial [Candidatus Margulisiibacteriota bacterium]
HALSSVLSELKGMGPKRVQRLYQTYHTVANMRQAVPAEMAKTIGIPLRLAEEVVLRLNESSSS